MWRWSGVVPPARRPDACWRPEDTPSAFLPRVTDPTSPSPNRYRLAVAASSTRSGFERRSTQRDSLRRAATPSVGVTPPPCATPCSIASGPGIRLCDATSTVCCSRKRSARGAAESGGVGGPATLLHARSDVRASDDRRCRRPHGHRLLYAHCRESPGPDPILPCGPGRRDRQVRLSALAAPES